MVSAIASTETPQDDAEGSESTTSDAIKSDIEGADIEDVNSENTDTGDTGVDREQVKEADETSVETSASDSGQNESAEIESTGSAETDQPDPADPDMSVYDHLHVEVSGPSDKAPVLLLHGWGSNSGLMGPIAQNLSDAYHIHNIDLPGHGLSPEPPAPMGVPEHAELVSAYIREELDGRPTTIIGHSNGGRIALFLAGRRSTSSLVNKLILISPSGIRPKRSLAFYLKTACAKALKWPIRILPGRTQTFVRDWLHHTVLWKLLGSSDYNTLSGVMRDTFVRTVNHYLDEDVGSVLCPTLLFWGDKDTSISRRQIDTLERSIPDAGVVVLKGAGHYAYLDEPATFLAASRYFLDSPDSSAVDDLDRSA